jgi:PTH1 family peptidyl-tRNA hydrolase
VGRPPEKMDAVTFVLAKFRKDELADVDVAVRGAATGVEIWIKEGISTAMNTVNVSLPDANDNSTAL